MCGVAGFAGTLRGVDDACAVATRMAQRLEHRGPDDSGIWHDAESRVWLVHRRLAILDLSDAGHQPMLAPSGRFVISYNGEIYNHLELRQRLSYPPSWRGHSDTETLLACLDAWGLETTLDRCVGMFAFALWDLSERTLYLARDRLGEKPLYYGWQGETLLFASEIGAIREYPGFDTAVDRAALAQFLDAGYFAAPNSVFRSVSKLPAGHYARIARPDLGPARASIALKSYWSARAKAAERFAGSLGEAADVLQTLLRKSIAGQLVADVPVGAFLSGGIDSSLVVALMQEQSARPVQTFTIGFDEAAFDESRHAAQVAAHLGTEHHEMRVTAADALRLVPRLPDLYSEPLADSSQLPTIIVAEHARSRVTVALSGDGGDELFCGYSRYFLTRALWRSIRWLPMPVRGLVKRCIASAPPEQWTERLQGLQALMPAPFRRKLPGDDLCKGANFLDARCAMDVYRTILSFSASSVPSLVLGKTAGSVPARSHGGGFLEEATLLDLETYLAEDILTKVDRAAMAVGLETRVPLLDHRVVEFALRLPVKLRVRGSTGKLPLRSVLSRYVPDRLVDRPKMGFSVPISQWLRTSLRPWAEDLLDEAAMRREGLLDAAAVRARWDEHLSGRRDWQYLLWAVLMFRSWHETVRNISSRDARPVH